MCLAGGKGGNAGHVDESINEEFADDLEHYKPLAAKYPEVDIRDLKVADKWVHRHPSLIRLTGVHPFNVEPPLPQLLDYGFYSPVNLHIVRNHGAVPKIKWEEHKRTWASLSRLSKLALSSSTSLTVDALHTCRAACGFHAEGERSAAGVYSVKGDGAPPCSGEEMRYSARAQQTGRAVHSHALAAGCASNHQG